jgi:hypothetical protein
MSQPLIYGLNRQITTIGSLGIGLVKDESRVRFVTSFCGPANVFRVRARITGQGSWNTLADLTGNVNEVVDVFTWDEIEVVCLVYDSTESSVKIVATSFDNALGPLFRLPDDTEVESSIVTFTSSDNSVTITGDSVTGVIDFVAIGGGAASKYTQEFDNTSDWTLNGANYEIEIEQTTHLKGTSPFIFVLDSANEIVETGKTIDSSGNILITVNSNPDLRFSGKLVIF